MALPPPRSAPPRPGDPASRGAGEKPSPSSSSHSGLRAAKDGDKTIGTYFLGRYRVVDELGVGGMASVHLGRMDGPGGFQKWVAIKRIHPHLVEDVQFVDMFLDEARIAAGINHANVAQVFDLGKDDNTYWIAMEYLHGEPLREVMRRAEEQRVRISPDLAARICSDAAEGLHAAHELRGKNGQLLGLVHRDVTPHNLFITYDGYTKVVDFGIAKVADRLSSTRAGTLKGKLAYMSPEQVRGAEVDRTTDVFALGVVLWELTTNYRLFRMDTDVDTLEKVQACIVPSPSAIVADYPVELESIVMKALSKRKHDRFQSAREFSRALQSFLMRRGAFVGPDEVSTFVRHIFVDRIQKREQHLAWAAEVTSTINVDQLRALHGVATSPRAASLPDATDEVSLADYVDAASSTTYARPSGTHATRPEDHASLMDDDEDVATTVASREHLEKAARSLGLVFPPAQVRAAHPAHPVAYTPPRAPSFGPPPPSPSPSASASPFSLGPHTVPLAALTSLGAMSGGFRSADEQTKALPSFADPDLGATVALDDARPFGAPPASPLYGARPFAASFPPPAAPQFGLAPPLTPAPTNAAAGGANPPYARRGQAHIETSLSLPRPDPAALWLAQQDSQPGERRNTGVLIAVVAVTALCVVGIGVLVWLKVHGDGDAVPATAASEASAVAAMTAAPTSTDAPHAPVASASVSAAITPAAAPIAPAPSPSPRAPAAVTPKEQAAPAAAAEQPGFLTVQCNPACDEIIDQGIPLGPSPVVRRPVRPGQHRITLKSGAQTKVISVIVESGQVASPRVSMK